MRKSRFLHLLLGGIFLGAVGCAAKAPPDPNDPAAVGIMQPQVLQRNLKWASDMVNERVAESEISEDEAKQHRAKYADSLIGRIDFNRMQPQQAWQYADIFRTAQRWDLAKKALEMAVAHAEKAGNQDRRVNDSLRLAQAQANLGERKEALETARSVYDAPDTDKGPILMAVAYEIAPALRGHGMDVEVAKLVEEAIGQHMKVVIDPKTEAGSAFIAAKWHHIRKGWELVVDLYRSAGKPELADQARERAGQMLSQQGRL